MDTPPKTESSRPHPNLPSDVEVGHIDGHEENAAPENMAWTCRACNTTIGFVLRRARLGRLPRQFNPNTEGARPGSVDQHSLSDERRKRCNGRARSRRHHSRHSHRTALPIRKGNLAYPATTRALTSERFSLTESRQFDFSGFF
jgi:hypothetical protein